jgi:hypothetical protein
MKKIILKEILIIATLIVMMQVRAFSQVNDSTSKVAPPAMITGSIDAYYRYNFNNPRVAPFNSLTSFTHSNNSFELGMASLRADHNFGKVSATIDLGFGTRAEEFAYNDANTRLAVKQLYLAYAPNPVLKFTFGSWATHVGYELLDAYLNRNYSMSYMFTNGPFSHTGLKADISLGGKSAFMVGISNPTDYRSAPSMPKSFIGQFSTGSKDDKLKAYFNVVAGKQNDYKKMFQGDIVASYAFSGKLSIAANGTIQSVKQDLDSTGNFGKHSTWSGLAIYINVDPSSWFGLTLRDEFISDKDEYLGLKSIYAPTLSANFKINNLVIIPELRFDRAGNSVFYKATDQSTRSSGTFVLAATYHF